MKFTFFFFVFGENWFFFFVTETQRKWSMAFNIFFLSYNWQSVGFLFHVIHHGCLCPCVLGFSLNDCTRGELNFYPLCVSVDTGRTLWHACAEWRLLYLLKHARPGCCHATAILETYSHTEKHAHNRHLSPALNARVLFVTIVTSLVLNHLPLLHLLYMFLFLVSLLVLYIGGF